ncbi:PucR family transcriptional regulator [Alloscardovia macacae]|uniref:PucR C-terminal helix-turn-helix domain-containing protein n=1 Tax=Alloscardovia macacae TaxID=1160091 RepID=A0A261F525_9BIFI|nr:helix-turn-helix domain-containing protein [Alloscardovia macacae]OZG54220.1 PucR C-terminal helix-turn-helix domain-containing protein [Alloscardovia macacae]
MIAPPQLDNLDTPARAAVELIVNECLTECAEKTDWYLTLGENEAYYLRVILLTAVADYITFAREHALNTAYDEGVSADELFTLAPLETTTKITLENVIDAIRIAVKNVEKHVSSFAPEGQEAAYVRAAMYFSREVAFSAAQIYSRVAVTRTIWDTRDEAFIIESLLNCDYSPSLQSRVANFKWQPDENFFAIVGDFDTSSSLRSGFVQGDLRNAVLQLGGQVCISSHDDFTILLIGMGAEKSRRPFLELAATLFDEIPTACIGPTRSRLEGASATLRAALNGFNARFAYPEHPNPMFAEDLLAERALFGDDDAQQELYEKVYQPLKQYERKTQILSTLQAFLFSGSSLEHTAQVLNVHPNTIRYRLKKSAEVTEWDATNAREAYILTTAIKIGRYKDSLREAEERAAAAREERAEAQREAQSVARTLEQVMDQMRE